MIKKTKPNNVESCFSSKTLQCKNKNSFLQILDSKTFKNVANILS